MTQNEIKTTSNDRYDIFLIGSKPAINLFIKDFFPANNLTKNSLRENEQKKEDNDSELKKIIFHDLTSSPQLNQFLNKTLFQTFDNEPINLFFIFCFSFNADVHSDNHMPFSTFIDFYQNIEKILYEDNENKSVTVTSLVVGLNAHEKTCIMTSERGQYLMESVKARAYIECYKESDSIATNYVNFDAVYDTIRHFLINPKSAPRIYLVNSPRNILSDPVFQEFCIVFGPSVLRTYSFASQQNSNEETVLKKHSSSSQLDKVTSTLIEMFKITSPEVKMALSRSAATNRPLTSAGGGIAFTMKQNQSAHYDFVRPNSLLPRKSQLVFDEVNDSPHDSSMEFQVFYFEENKEPSTDSQQPSFNRKLFGQRPSPSSNEFHNSNPFAMPAQPPGERHLFSSW